MKSAPKKGEPCVLYDRLCTKCGECEMCDLDPSKKCDNCGKCLEEYMPQTDEHGFVTIEAEFEQNQQDTEEENDTQLSEIYKYYGYNPDDKI